MLRLCRPVGRPVSAAAVNLRVYQRHRTAFDRLQYQHLCVLRVGRHPLIFDEWQTDVNWLTPFIPMTWLISGGCRIPLATGHAARCRVSGGPMHQFHFMHALITIAINIYGSIDDC